MPLTSEQRQRNESSIRAAMDRLLRGDLPAGGHCDLKTLAREAGVARTGFYPRTTHDRTTPGPYQHLADEFHRRLRDLHTSGIIPDPRDKQIARLTTETSELRRRVTDRDNTITELLAFKTRALSQLAAQYDEITQLRQAATQHQTPPTRPAADVITLVPRR
jgi:hypothetical protein